MQRYVDALAPGSCVIASVGILDDTPEADRFAKLYGSGPAQLYRHKLADVRTFFGDLDMVPPGIADTRSWRAGWDMVPEVPQRVVAVYAGAGRLY